MKPNYKNWMPKGMIIGFISVAAILFAATVLFATTNLIASSTPRWITSIILGAAFLACAGFAIWSAGLYSAFSYNGKRQLSKQIIEGVAAYVTVLENGKILDVGCGSGALAIACAKKNPGGTVVGIDRWGKEYSSYSKELCTYNAKAEGVQNISFASGNAVKLDFPDESFDAVTSNYVYHNIPGKDKKKLLLETLRVLKKGGVFAIHDLMGPQRYGDMAAFAANLKKEGYEKVELIDTASGMFMSQKEAKRLVLRDSTLLYGIK
jgi:SAM-dependent methyltransferase